MSSEFLKGLSSVVDEKALLARCLNNLDFAERILKLLDDRCGVELGELDAALASGDTEAICRIAHRLTGACANAAAFELQACASNLRVAAAKPSLPETSLCLEELRRESKRFSAALTKQPASTTASV